MNLFTALSSDHPVAHAVLILSLVAMTGLLLGNLKFKGIGLGIAGVLFSGIVFGHFGFQIDPKILDFTRDFGLVLFVYTIGMQVGPGFFSSMRKQGLPLNGMAVVTVALSAGIALAIGKVMGFPMAAIVGVFCGGTTSTPSLGAAQEALKSLPGATPEQQAMPALAYASAYPFGVLGIILVMLFLRWIFRIDSKKEAAAFRVEQGLENKKLHRMSIQIEEEAFHGMKLGDVALFPDLKVVVTRIFSRRSGTVSIATPSTFLSRNDVLLAVGKKENVEQAARLLGGPSQLDLMKAQGQVINRDVIVTHKAAFGQSLKDLGLEELYGVAISRVTRGGVEMTAIPELNLQFGDRLRVVGEADDIKQVAAVLGNSTSALSRTHFIPVFIGISLGVIVGSIPLQFPNMPAPITLGLAGGPLVVAILLSRLGRIGSLIWYMPLGANLALRELGLMLFLSCVGLRAGTTFVDILMHGDGLRWMAAAAFVTVIPPLIIGLAARTLMRQNFMNIIGVLAGTMTDSSALAFAINVSESDAPSVAYATVYPLTLLLRVLTAQILILFFS